MENNKFESKSLFSLPPELLVYIFSSLPTARDKANIRYVSSRLRSVMETSSLWSEFVWPYYDSREEHCVCNLVKSFGGYIKRLSFPDHVPPLEIFQYCVNAIQLDLATQPTAKLGPSEIRTAIKHMTQLQKLDFHWIVPNDGGSDLKDLLLDCSNIEELTIRIQIPHSPGNVHMPIRVLQLRAAVYSFLLHWKEKGFSPSNLSIVCRDDVSSIIDEVLGSWSASNNSPPICHADSLRLYSDLKVPLDLFPVLPGIQLHLSQATAPCADVNKLGLVSLNGVVTLSNHSHGNNTLYKAVLLKDNNNIKNYQFNVVPIDLNSVTEFDLSFTVQLDYIDLDRLAVACPNLQRLDISHTICLSRLQGLRSIANRCHNLQGLNLLGIQVEDHMQLWEILSDMKLTHLAIELCVIFPVKGDSTYMQNLSELYDKFVHLKALHLVHNKQFSCKFYEDKHAVLLSHFPSLTCCLLDEVPYQCSNIMKNILMNCKELKYFRCCYSKSLASIKPSLTFLCNLQQLYIHSVTAQVSNTFMHTVSSHGGLEHVLLHVFVISLDGLAKLLMNSPKLLMFRVNVRAIIQEDPELLPKLANNWRRLDPDYVKIELKKRFSNKKLFHSDGFDIKKGPLNTHHNWEELNIDVTSKLF